MDDKQELSDELLAEAELGEDNGDMDVLDESEDDGINEDDEGDGDEPMEDVKAEDKVYIPGRNEEEGGELVCDESAYVMYHQAQTGKQACFALSLIKFNIPLHSWDGAFANIIQII